MAALPLSLSIFLFFSLLSTTSTTAAHPTTPRHPKSPTDFIRSSCLVTRYPALCFHFLLRYANEIHYSERQLALTALEVSLSRARSAAGFVSNISKAKRISHLEFEAVKDCIETMGDSVDQLSRSIKELGHTGHTDGQDFLWHMSNVQTWVSAALTDESTCVDGVSEPAMDAKIKDSIKMRVMNVAQVTSNALALVNRFASRHRVGEVDKN